MDDHRRTELKRWCATKVSLNAFEVGKSCRIPIKSNHLKRNPFPSSSIISIGLNNSSTGMFSLSGPECCRFKLPRAL